MSVTTRAFRGAVALATVGGALLMTAPAPAQQAQGTYTLTAQVDATSYPARSYRWGDPQEVAFTRISDQSSQALMNMTGSDNHTVTITETYAYQGHTVVVLTLTMTGVRVTSVKSEASVGNLAGPEETIVLRPRTLKYMFQPYSQQTAIAGGTPITVSYPPFPGDNKH